MRGRRANNVDVEGAALHLGALPLELHELQSQVMCLTLRSPHIKEGVLFGKRMERVQDEMFCPWDISQ